MIMVFAKLGMMFFLKFLLYKIVFYPVAHIFVMIFLHPNDNNLNLYEICEENCILFIYVVSPM